MKIETRKPSITHALAQCHDCGWEEGIGFGSQGEMRRLKRSIRSHVKASGHVVCLEIGSVCTYGPQKTGK